MAAAGPVAGLGPMRGRDRGRWCGARARRVCAGCDWLHMLNCRILVLGLMFNFHEVPLVDGVSRRITRGKQGLSPSMRVLGRDTIRQLRFDVRWSTYMTSMISGIVRDGKIVPAASLPEGLQVQITVPAEVVIPPELQAEMEDWSQGNADALAMVERLAEGLDCREEGFSSSESG